MLTRPQAAGGSSPKASCTTTRGGVRQPFCLPRSRSHTRATLTRFRAMGPSRLEALRKQRRRRIIGRCHQRDATQVSSPVFIHTQSIHGNVICVPQFASGYAYIFFRDRGCCFVSGRPPMSPCNRNSHKIAFFASNKGVKSHRVHRTCLKWSSLGPEKPLHVVFERTCTRSGTYSAQLLTSLDASSRMHAVSSTAKYSTKTTKKLWSCC